MGRNNVLIVDIDSERDSKSQIIIEHAERSGDHLRKTDKEYCVINDMATLCEALCTLIHAADNEGIKETPASLRDCIKHLESGVSDSSYFAKITT